jgi:DNA replication protein DnaC
MPSLPGQVPVAPRNNNLPSPKAVPVQPNAGAAKIVRLTDFNGSSNTVDDDAPLYVDADACPYCKGSGFLRMDAAVGDPNFGKLVPCKCRDAEKQRRAFDELKRNSNLDNFRDLTFEMFNPRVPGTREAYEAALRFAGDPSKWLLFIGNYGCGKTHLAAAIANDALSKQVPLYFAVVPDLLDYLRATFDPNSGESYDRRFETIRNVPLLILDDLGTENAKPWAREKLYQIINHRYNAKLPTVITTNNDMDTVDGRIRSRLMDRALCDMILMQADDYRMMDVQQRTRLKQSAVARNNFNQRSN